MTEILGKLFGSPARVRIMRLFLLNHGSSFETQDIAHRSKTPLPVTRHEITLLLRAKLIKRCVFKRKVILGQEKNVPKKIKRISGWCLNYGFPYRHPLTELLVATGSIKADKLGKLLRPCGRIKLLLAAGIFTQNQSSRLDLLIVGDNLKRQAIERIIRNLEAEIGKELSYAIFDTDEFLYRASMYDKLVRDIVDFPHEKIIDVDLLTQVPRVSS